MTTLPALSVLADTAFRGYDFGPGFEVTDMSGWEYTTPGTERTRKVYVETPAEDDGPAPRWQLTFTVRFNTDGTLNEAYAIDSKGSIWGSMPEPAAAQAQEPTTQPQGLTELPQSLIDAARKSRHLSIEGNAILFSVDQGYAPFTTITINHWLALRGGSLVLEINISQRPNAKAEDWMGGDQFAVSEPMTEAQALQVLDYWSRVAGNTDRLLWERQRLESEISDSFGPRSHRPWEEDA